ncbi:MAG: hypothetical protein WAV50_00440 [Minisyncoccia bacterium]
MKTEEGIRLNECGLVLRDYAKDESGVAEVVNRLYRSVMRAKEIGFWRIVALVPAEKDCGLTAAAIRAKLAIASQRNGTLVLSPGGNEKSDVLNVGVRALSENRCSYSFIVSNKALGYMTFENVMKVNEALGAGAFAAGLAVRDNAVPPEEDDVYLGVLAGRLTDTFCAWDNESLENVGGFDSIIGVEEMAPIVRGSKLGFRVAPVLPTDQVGVDVSLLRAERHAWVTSTKYTRQLEEAVRAGGSIELIEQSVLSGYPK